MSKKEFEYDEIFLILVSQTKYNKVICKIGQSPGSNYERSSCSPEPSPKRHLKPILKRQMSTTPGGFCGFCACSPQVVESTENIEPPTADTPHIQSPRQLVRDQHEVMYDQAYCDLPNAEQSCHDARIFFQKEFNLPQSNIFSLPNTSMIDC